MPPPAAPLADRDEALRQAAARAEWAALRQRLDRLADALFGWPERAAARAQLRALTDRELADLGLSRSEIDAAVAGRH